MEGRAEINDSDIASCSGIFEVKYGLFFFYYSQDAAYPLSGINSYLQPLLVSCILDYQSFFTPRWRG